MRSRTHARPDDAAAVHVLGPPRPEPPYDLDAETSVLGSILLDPNAIERCVAEGLDPDDFYRENNGAIYQAALNLHRECEPIDNVSMAAELAKTGRLERVGGRGHVAWLQESVPTAANVGHYAAIVRNRAERRRRKALAAVIDRMAGDLEVELAEVDRHLAQFVGSLPSANEDEFTALPAPPAFPLRVLPSAARTHVERLAETGLPLDFLGSAAVGTLAGAVGAGPALDVNENWKARAILWFGLVGAPGTGKTPSIASMAAPLQAVQLAIAEDHKRKRQEWSELPLPERRRQPRPSPVDLVVGDTTVEALARQMDNQPATILIADELRGMLASLGQYKSGGSDYDRLLELWSGLPWSYKRVTDDLSLYIAEPTLTIVGGIQPSRLAALGDGDDGLRARWLLVVGQQPAQDIGSPFGKRVDAGRQLWAALVLSLNQHRAVRRDWRMDPDAMALWEAARRRLRPGAVDEPDHVRELALKADNYALRLALVLAETHRAASAGPDDERIARPGVLTADVMAMAVELVDYFVGHRRAMRMSGTNLMARPAERDRDRAVEALADWLEGRPDKRSTRREIQRAHVAGTRTADEVAALIARYGDSYPARVYQEPSSSGPPRTVVLAPSARRSAPDAARQPAEGSARAARTVATVATVATPKPKDGGTAASRTREASSDPSPTGTFDPSPGDSGNSGDSAATSADAAASDDANGPVEEGSL